MMDNFKSVIDYFKFEMVTKHGNRFIRSPEIELFLKTLISSSHSRRIEIPEGTTYWRAQMGIAEPQKKEWEEGTYLDTKPRPHPMERMKPLQNKATEGRANPKGIAYLYLATDQKTAMAEVRPWVGSEISLGSFVTQENIVLLDCARFHEEKLSLKPNPEKKTIERGIWTLIDRSFSEPITTSDNTPDYVPTQILAEFFKNNEFSGIKYKSTLGPGYNIVLFRPEVAELTQCELYQTKKISFEFEGVEDARYTTSYGEYLKETKKS